MTENYGDWGQPLANLTSVVQGVMNPILTREGYERPQTLHTAQSWRRTVQNFYDLCEYAEGIVLGRSRKFRHNGHEHRFWGKVISTYERSSKMQYDHMNVDARYHEDPGRDKPMTRCVPLHRIPVQTVDT